MESMSATLNRRHGRRDPPDLREGAVRMFHKAITGSGERYGAITRIARKHRVAPESLRKWVMQAELAYAISASTIRNLLVPDSPG